MRFPTSCFLHESVSPALGLSIPNWAILNFMKIRGDIHSFVFIDVKISCQTPFNETHKKYIQGHLLCVFNFLHKLNLPPKIFGRSVLKI
jgi:hypothetical protein